MSASLVTVLVERIVVMDEAAVPDLDEGTIISSNDLPRNVFTAYPLSSIHPGEFGHELVNDILVPRFYVGW